jgi:hypothetical protein
MKKIKPNEAQRPLAERGDPTRLVKTDQAREEQTQVCERLLSKQTKEKNE